MSLSSMPLRETTRSRRSRTNVNSSSVLRHFFCTPSDLALIRNPHSAFHRYFTTDTGWTLPALFAILRDLRDIAHDVCIVGLYLTLGTPTDQRNRQMYQHRRRSAWKKQREYCQDYSHLALRTERRLQVNRGSGEFIISLDSS